MRKLLAAGIACVLTLSAASDSLRGGRFPRPGAGAPGGTVGAAPAGVWADDAGVWTGGAGAICASTNVPVINRPVKPARAVNVRVVIGGPQLTATRRADLRVPADYGLDRLVLSPDPASSLRR